MTCKRETDWRLNCIVCPMGERVVEEDLSWEGGSATLIEVVRRVRRVDIEDSKEKIVLKRL